MHATAPGKTGPLVNSVTTADSSESNPLQGATVIQAVPSGHKVKKVKTPDDVNAILKPALTAFMDAREKVSKDTKRMSEQSGELAVNTHPWSSDSETLAKREKRSAFAEKIIAAHQSALAEYDEAISKIKKIHLTITLQGKAAQDVMGFFEDLGLTEPTTGELLRKLREIRAEAYDELQLARAFNAYLGANHDQIAVKAAEDTLNVLRWAKATDVSALPPEHRQMAENALANEQLTLAVQPGIWQRKTEAVKAKFELCADILASMPLDGVTLYEGQPAMGALKEAMVRVLRAREDDFDKNVRSTFDARYSEVVQEYKKLLGEQPSLQAKEMQIRINQVFQLSLQAKMAGIEAMKYAYRTTDLYDKALAPNIDFPSDRRDILRADKKKFQDKTNKVLLTVFDLQGFQLPLLIQNAKVDYDAALTDAYDHVHRILAKAKTVHGYCTNTIAGNAKGIPEHLLYSALQTLPSIYEDAARQLRYLAHRFHEQGQGVAANDRIVEEMRYVADTIERMAEMAESQLGQLPAAGKEDPGVAAEAERWIEDTLRTLFPRFYKPDTAVDDVTEELTELEVTGTPADVQGASTTAGSKAGAVPTKGPTPSQKNPAKELENAIRSAENALHSEQTQRNLASLAKESEKYSRIARQGEQDGASPCTVEDYMKLAAEAESKQAEKKTGIAKKFGKAFSKMEPGHPKYDSFNDRIAALDKEIRQHKDKQDQLVEDGERLRIRISKRLPPTDSLFNYLHGKGQVESVKRRERKELDSLDSKGNPRLNPRTNEVLKDPIDEYVIAYKGGKKIVAHFHYKTMNSNDMDIVACHFKTWEQRHKGMQYELEQAEEGADIKVHRSRTNRETLAKLQEMTGDRKN